MELISEALCRLWLKLRMLRMHETLGTLRISRTTLRCALWRDYAQRGIFYDFSLTRQKKKKCLSVA